MLYVFVRAIGRDLERNTNEALAAATVPDHAIPPQPAAAAKVFLSYVNGRSREFRWMKGLGNFE